MPNPTVTRKIHFYRAEAGLEASGRPIAFPTSAVLRHLQSMPFSARGRYLEMSDGNALCCWVDRHHPPQRLRLGVVRRNDLPEVETTGDITPLNISPNAGLVEVIHVVFFGNQIVGADFNFYGPRMSRLGFYLAQKANDFPHVQFNPLLRQDASARLQRLREISLFQLRIRTAYAQELMNADRDLFQAFEAARRISHAPQMEIILRPLPHSRTFLDRATLGLARRLARRPTLREEADRFVVKGFDPASGGIDEVDVLDDELITSKRIALLNPRTRALDPEAAFSAVEAAREDLGDELIRAASVSG
jgi:hypothetical protein